MKQKMQHNKKTITFTKQTETKQNKQYKINTFSDILGCFFIFIKT